MKNNTLFAGALVAALGLAGLASAQVPSGGPDAKGNAPLKHAHTVNDGGAKRGATSFTEKEARKHIENAGYTDVSPLTKGDDGVWRGTAMKGGASRPIGMDFKGNVVEGMPVAGPAPAPVRAMSGDTKTNSTTTTTAATTAPAMATETAPMVSKHHGRRRHRHMRHGHMHRAMGSMTGDCANPGLNGAACSGVDTNRNGISDKEDRAIKAGAKP